MENINVQNKYIVVPTHYSSELCIVHKGTKNDNTLRKIDSNMKCNLQFAHKKDNDHFKTGFKKSRY